MPKNTPKEIPIQQVITALLDNNKPFSPTYLHRFSELNAKDMEEIKKIWAAVLPDRRAALLEDLEELADTDSLLNFDALCNYVLNDSDPRVRAHAVCMFWENDDPHLAKTFMNMLKKDPEEIVRSAAASALGLYIYLAEMEEAPEALGQEVEASLLEGYKSKDSVLVRRHCMESLGYSSLDEVTDIILAAYNLNQHDWLVSSLFAMGRSSDQRWENEVMKMIDHEEPDIQLEAVRAAGELELASAREPLLKKLEDENLDDDVRDAVVWSLSQIGGEDVRETLEKLMEDCEDDDESEYLEEVLDNLNFTEGFGLFDMFDFDKDNIEDMEELEEDEDSSNNGSKPGKKNTKK